MNLYDKETIRAFASFTQELNKYFYLQAQQYDMPVVVLRNSAFDKDVESAVEGDEGLQVLENYIQQGFTPLNIDSTIIKMDTTDFSKVDEADIIKQIREVH